MMHEIIEVTEQHIVPTAELRTMTIEAPNGAIVEAPIEAWLFALVGELSKERQSLLCERVASLAKQAQSPVMPGQFIHIRPDPLTGNLTRIESPADFSKHIRG